MKKFIKKIMLSMAALVACLGFALPMVAVSAEEVSANPENSALQSEYSAESTVSEEVGETEEMDENSAVLESDTHTFENFLAWTEQEAERYGYGDEYTAALEAIKTAATTKQVTLSTVASFALVAVFIAYLIYKKITDKKFRDSVAALVKTSLEQFDKLNELVDGTNANGKTEEEIKAEEQALKEELKKTNKALSNLISGFLHFTDGVAMKAGKKAEVQRDCMNALHEVDGVNANENHEE